MDPIAGTPQSLKRFPSKKLLLLLPIFIILVGLGLFISNKTILLSPPMTYSSVRFDPKVEVSMKPGDIITGKGIPEAKVSISITPNGTNSEVTTDKDGRWSYNLPRNLATKNYNLTITILDKANNIASIKSYNIKLI